MAVWNPWQDLEALRRQVERAFEGVDLRSEPGFRTAFLPGRAARRYPLINVHEDQDALYIEALAPGVDPESLSLTAVQNVLMISGEKRRIPGDVKPEAFHRSERATGKFVRHIELPVEVDDDQVHADYSHGLLIVTLPKAERIKPKPINVQVS